jgi:hypothetical protein
MVGEKEMFSEGEIYGNYVFVKEKDGYGLFDRRDLSIPSNVTFSASVKSAPPNRKNSQVESVIRLMRDGSSYSDAIQKVANECRVTKCTVRCATTRRFGGISAAEFQKMVDDGSIDDHSKSYVPVERRKISRGGLAQVREVVDMMRSGEPYTDAVNKVASARDISRGTVIDATTRRCGRIRAREFIALVDGGEIEEHLEGLLK